MWHLFLAGVGIGLAMAIPIGPVNLLVIARAVRSGTLAAFLVGLGGMVGDTILALFAGFGVTAAMDLLRGHERVVQLASGTLLAAIGVVMLRVEPRFDRPAADGRGVVGGAATALALTLTNPGAALAMLALIGSLGPLGQTPGGAAETLTVVAGVAFGSTLWWAGLAALVGRLHGRLGERWLRRIHATAGILFLGAGLALLIGLPIGVRLV